VAVGLALLAAPATVHAGGSPIQGAGASTSPAGSHHFLPKTRAYAKAYDVLEHDQIADLFDDQPIRGWQLQPARECERLSARRVRCAFAVQRAEPLGECGGTITLIRWSWYVGWRISAHPGPDSPCDARAAGAAQGRHAFRSIRSVY
jgi:hypothetical protein